MSLADVPHYCAAIGCRERITRGQLMCKPHWFAIPKALRDQVWNTWRAFNGFRPQRDGSGAARHAELMARYRDAVRAAVAYLEVVPAPATPAPVAAPAPERVLKRQLDWVYSQRNEDIVGHYQAGKSLRVIGKLVRLSHARIQQILVEAGIQRRAVGRRPQ